VTRLVEGFPVPQRPNKYLAAVLGFFIQPVGMLYVARPAWALTYFLLAIATAAATIVFPSGNGETVVPTLASLALALSGAVFAYRFAVGSPDGVSRPAYSRWYGLLGTVIAFALIAFLLRAFFFEPFRLPSTAMAPSLPAGSYIVVEKWGYGHYGTFGISLSRTSISSPMARGDVLVFDYPERTDLMFIKRLVGLPGDRVEYRNKRLAINGVAVPITDNGATVTFMPGGQLLKLASERLGDMEHDILIDESRPALRLSAVRNFPQREKCQHDEGGFSCTVPAGNYFMMGDNRDNSDDSRYWGFVPASMIVGKVAMAFVPRRPIH
jgi:signal peptidase I